MILGVGGFHLSATKGLIRGIPGVAHADDIEKVREELKRDINRLERRVDSQEGALSEILRLSMIAEICRIYWLRMEADGLALRQYNDSFEQLQQRYAALNDNRRYPAIECGPQR